ncbi:UDP-N-acetylmuramoyl-L-alanyl-D-glutamate--2,6-diaminopimelate ligase [Cytobacillus sp. Sa5YUA1]|uniref:UDP-N-acetylmuramyl-tripeptide synthetase n=1 Tax=Cytobacillus stercorigallinarum TaxID=2762240 RepID=A0ABR8QRG5_9BACI|nr:UDP-N-acetylmuramoyl-L-alanyl-D-glutamate--2,6-diaminopimelate ligase [Cytobacillus stercorigallinarum]MBD7938133.1 UDP-N-acetylmuramoyl-L-alanyl-D-glutamate--2,6-diaminopimelate ligase [Cytobacillus stercorigallinarum]
MKLFDVFHLLQTDLKEMDHEIEVSGLTSDSRKVKQGYLFIAIAGFENDGHKYIEEAIKNGAIAVIGEKRLLLSVPYIQVRNSRKTLGKLASIFYSHPSKKHRLIGITGTNGKTTTAYLIHHLLKEAGFSCGMIGTVENKINNHTKKAKNTTPDAVEIQSLLDESMDDFIILEISSHALHQHRTEGLQLDIAVFTNLTHDHMDYHHTIEEYYNEKKKIFSLLKEEGVGLVNIEDTWGEKIAREQVHHKIKTIGTAGDYDLQLTVKDARYQLKLTSVERESIVAESPLPGKHNLYNTAIAIAACLEAGISKEVITQGLKNFRGVPGRWEKFHNRKGAVFIIDYAHTEDALRYLLQTAKENSAKKIYMVFGFRGKRDKSKRVKMVKVASTYCQQFILTSDDINGESKSVVEEELYHLIPPYNNGEVMMDRTLAIKTMWEKGGSGDWVFIIGKGSENYQDIFHLQTKNDIETIHYLIECEKDEGC